MFTNYLKIAVRNMRKHKIYSLITISGLVLGLGFFIMFAYTNGFISSFDTFHQKAGRIYGLVQVLKSNYGEGHSAITPAPLLPALLKEYPGIEAATRYFPPGRMIVKHRDKIFYESGIRFVDPDFLSIFTFKMIAGNPENALSRPNSIVLTRDTMKKYFGAENPLGKSLSLDNKIDVIVTGVTENAPRNSSIGFDFLVSMKTADALYAWTDDWKVKNQASFLLLEKEAKSAELEKNFPAFVKKHYPDTPETPKRLYLHPLLDFSLKSKGIECYWRTASANFAVLWIVAVILLLIACINFMNLSTARYVTRVNEVGMRKVIGASRLQLIRQFLGESVLMALISLPAAIIFYELVRPVFASYIGDIFGSSILENPGILVLALIVTILTGLFAGSYPAFYLSAFKPVKVLKGNHAYGKQGGGFRKLLVVVQFTVSIILILLTIISIKQAQHNLKVDLGYDRNNIIAVEIPAKALANLETLKKQLSQHKDVVSVSAAAALPVEWDTELWVQPEGRDANDKMKMNVYGIDYDFIEMLGMKITQGRSFSRDFGNAKYYIINESAVRQLQWKDPIGKQLTIENQKGTVIGVAKDFHFKSIYLKSISPAVLRLDPEGLRYMLVRYSISDRFPGVSEYIREQWKVLAPDLPFETTTLNNRFQDVFSGDKTPELSGILGITAIFLSCLGLFGLSSFSVERKIKEIGIRKVFGASVTGIIKMLIKQFVKLVVIANVIAIPIAYYLMNAINRAIYAYPVDIGIDVFIFTFFITLLVAFFTVTSQTLKAASANPVDSLRYE